MTLWDIAQCLGLLRNKQACQSIPEATWSSQKVAAHRQRKYAKKFSLVENGGHCHLAYNKRQTQKTHKPFDPDFYELEVIMSSSLIDGNSRLGWRWWTNGDNFTILQFWHVQISRDWPIAYSRIYEILRPTAASAIMSANGPASPQQAPLSQAHCADNDIVPACKRCVRVQARPDFLRVCDGELDSEDVKDHYLVREDAPHQSLANARRTVVWQFQAAVFTAVASG